MDAQSLKEQLSPNDIITLLTQLGAEPYEQNGQIIARAICHNGHSHKMYYYDDTKMIHCYTNCGSMDIFELIQKLKNIEFSEAFKYIKDYFGYEDELIEYNYDDIIDLSFFNKFNKVIYYEPLKTLSDSVLNRYDDKYHISWVKEGIMPSTMKKFDIKMSIENKQIIIPHRNEDGYIVGVRARNLDPLLVDKGLKYTPVKQKNVFLNHPTGATLYGLYENMDNIMSTKKLVLFESEKSVLQLDSFYNGHGIGVCMSGSAFSDRQLNLIKNLPIEEVIIAVDKEFENIGDTLEKYYAEKVEKTIANKLKPYFSVSVIWDKKGLLDMKDSPTDRGKSIWLELFKNRISLIR